MQRIIIDTDAGVDDALAILYALRSPEVRIEGVTTVFGNVPLVQATRNVAEILAVAGALGSFPVATGADGPLSGTTVDAKDVHGEDGLGGWTRGHAAPEMAISATPAHRLIAELARQYPGEITLVTIGPLTNVALALRVDGEGMRKLKNVVIMGGNIQEPGNITAVAEFNINADAQAARDVVRSGMRPLLVGLDVTRKAVFTRERLESVIGDRKDERASFIRCISEQMFSFYRGMRGGDFFFLHDPLAMAAALDRSLVKTREMELDVETSGELTRGMIVAERRACRKPVPNAEFAVTVEDQRFLEEFSQRLR